MRNRRPAFVPWVVWLLWDFTAALDLVNDQGAVDHGKVVGVVAFATLTSLGFARGWPPLGHMIVLCSVIFGWLGMRTFLASKAATSTETITTALEATSERDPGDERE